MAMSLFKSLQCKSTAFDDVAYDPKPKSKSNSNSNSNSKSKPLIPSAASCGNSSQALRDVVFLFPKHPHPLPKKPPEKKRNPNPNPNHPPPPKPKSKHKSKPANNQKKPPTIPSSPVPAVAAAGPTSFPTLTELPAGHSSRRVVEIIFGSSWSHSGSPAPFPGRIEMLFRVHNPARTVARFEEYRSAVRLLAGGSDARCSADGNEMMRFHCGGDAAAAAADGIYDAGVVWPAGERGIRTFAGSGGAHESGGGGGPGRRAMLVCRVIAGRVRSGSDPVGVGESVCGSGKGELVVFDPRAVLPCFLIIYKI